MSFAPLALATMQQKRSGRPFIIKVKHTAGFTVTLPLWNNTGYNYNFVVDWGDGSVGLVTSATDSDRVHTYASGDNGGQPWVVTMTGTLEGWLGNATGLKEYIVEVTQWGRTGFKTVSMTNCTKLVACYGKLTTTQTSFNSMFYNCALMTTCEVGEWDVSNITDFSGMFKSCSVLTALDFSNWNVTSSATSFYHFCYASYALTTVGDGDLSGWNMTNVTSIENMFMSCRALSGSLNCSNWNLGKCTGFSYVNSANGAFADMQNITTLDLSGWTLNTTSTYTLRGLCRNNLKMTSVGDLSGWNTSKCTGLESAFCGCSKLESVDCHGWNLSSCTSFYDSNYGSTFEACTSLTTLDLSGWTLNTTSTYSMRELCNGDTALTTVGGLSGWNLSKCTSLQAAFYNCKKLTSSGLGDISNWNLSSCSSLQSAFYHNDALTTLDLSGWTLNTTSNISLYGMLEYCGALTGVGDLSGWNTSKVSSIAVLFGTCTSLKSVDCHDWDLSNCTGTNFIYVNSANGVFRGCTSLKTLDLSGWTFSTTTTFTIQGLCRYCTALTTVGDISGWNLSKCTSLAALFDHCTSLTSVDCHDWDLSSCVEFGDVYGMTFSSCTSLTTLDLSGWTLNTTSTYSLAQLCSGDTALTTVGDISGWNPSKCTSMSNTFYNCGLTSINCSGWDLSSCTNFQAMFASCDSLTSINCSNWMLNSTNNISFALWAEGSGLTSIDVSTWDWTKINNTNRMFNNCWSLAGTIVIPATCSFLSGQTFGCIVSRYDLYPTTAPTVTAGKYGTWYGPVTPADLHVPVGASGYGEDPWNRATTFNQPINYDL